MIFLHPTISAGCELDLLAIDADLDQRLVYGVMADRPPYQRTCSDIGSSQSFVVAVARDRLPSGQVTFRVMRKFQRCPDCGREAEQVQVEL